MFKLILSLVLIFSATLIGNSFSQKIINRRKTLTYIVSAINKIKTLICFGGMEIAVVIEKTLCTQEFPLIDYRLMNEGTAYDKSFEKSIEKIDNHFALTESDKKLLAEFGTKLGDTDIAGQVAHTELYAELFSEKLNSVKIQENSKTKLYRILGFSFGCAVSLLVI